MTEEKLQETTRKGCAKCGGQNVFDPETQGLKCIYCGGIEEIHIDPEQEIVSYPLEEARKDARLQNWGEAKRVIHCDNCGANSVLDQVQTALSCAFCGSSYVVEQNEDAGIHPESLLPFLVTKDRALELFRRWKKKRWLAPRDFKKHKLDHQLQGIYIPYWSYDSDTKSRYTAQVGTYHYRTVTRTRTVNGKREQYQTTERYTVWRPTSGTHQEEFRDILVHASRQMNDKHMEAIGPYPLERLLPYRPDYLSGFAAEKYSVDVESGWARGKQMIESILRRHITRRIGGDEVRNLRIHTRYSRNMYKHVLLPVWNSSYVYKDKTYPYIVNGQTGKVTGDAPISPWRVTFLVLLVLVIITVIIIFGTK